MYIFYFFLNVVYIYCFCSCCTVRYSMLGNALIYYVFLVTALPLFTCDNPFSFRDIIGRNQGHSEDNFFFVGRYSHSEIFSKIF
jgi:hypothetical protein